MTRSASSELALLAESILPAGAWRVAIAWLSAQILPSAGACIIATSGGESDVHTSRQIITVALYSPSGMPRAEAMAIFESLADAVDSYSSDFVISALSGPMIDTPTHDARVSAYFTVEVLCNGKP